MEQLVFIRNLMICEWVVGWKRNDVNQGVQKEKQSKNVYGVQVMFLHPSES